MSHDEIVRRMERLEALVRESYEAWCSVREALPVEQQNLVGKPIQAEDSEASLLLMDLRHD